MDMIEGETVMKILNLHGFMGEADNKNYKALCEIVPAESIISPQLNSAYFVEDNDLILIDCPATSYQKVKKMKWERFDNIYVLITHTHGDHSGGVGTMLQYVWFASGMKKKVTIVAPSEEVKADLLLLLMRIEGCEAEWFNIIVKISSLPSLPMIFIRIG